MASLSDTARRLALPLRALLASLLLAGALAACETTDDVIDAANPTGWFSDDEEETTEVEAKPTPGEDEDYPRLATVPEKPPEPEIKSRFEDLRSGLVSDRENAQYSDEAIRRTPPPDRARADAAMQALRQPPEEPPTAERVAETAPEAPEAPETTDGQGAGSEPSVPTVAPEVSAPSSAPSPTLAPSDAAAEPGAQPAPEPQPVERQAAAPAPAPEPLSGGAQAEAPQSPAPPPDSAADMARSADDAAPPPSGQDAPLASGERMIATIYFPGGGSALTDHDRDILRQVADIFARGGQNVRIVGHSSADGGEAGQDKALVNYKTSLDRASAVAGALVDYGVPRDALSVDARGAKQLRYAESTQAGIAGNRRAEVFITF